MKIFLAIIAIWAIFHSPLIAEPLQQTPKTKLNNAQIKKSSSLFGITPWKRNEFRPNKAAFEAKYLAIDCQVSAQKPLEGAIYVKDKDGNFFQYRENITFKGDGKKQTIQCVIDSRGAFWQSYSNNSSWNSQIASAIYEVGISLWSKDPQIFDAKVSNLRFLGKRDNPKLKITSIQLPQNSKVGKVTPVKFQLSREFFNPFDPQEISVDIIWQTPNKKEITFPAFFTQDCQISWVLTTEKTQSEGIPHWEARFLPQISGNHQFKIKITHHKESFLSQWYSFKVEKNSYKGIVEVSKRNAKYFSYQDGTPFIPIGLNIHANPDYRAEARYRIFPVANRGVLDYKEYFEQCAKNGINCIEIWMASWTFSLEWSSRRNNYMGIGRYNLINAARLDKVFEYAKKYNILINLVLDPHGKFSTSVTQEWHENPFNKNSTYAKSDGGFIASNEDIFTNKKFAEYWKNRNRYIAARWGQNPNIFAIELWSEVNLVLNFYNQSYPKKTVDIWHSQMIKDYQKYTPLRHLITTHVSGDIHTNRGTIRLWEIPEVTHLVGDAYRSSRIPMADQMRTQRTLIDFPKPCLVTEFGGTAQGSNHSLHIAEFHAALWSSIFQQQAGLPFNWWHDFVILGGHLKHVKAVSNYLKKIDLLDPANSVIECPVSLDVNDLLLSPVSYNTRFHWQRKLNCMAIINNNAMYGWVYNTERVFNWENRSNKPLNNRMMRNATLTLPPDFIPGNYKIEFFDTLSGKIIHQKISYLSNSLTIPDFEDDIAFILRREK